MSTLFPPYACCDPDSLRRADAPSRISVVQPNPLTLAAGAWSDISIKHPAVIIPLTPPTGQLYARPYDRGTSTTAATLQASAYVCGPVLRLSAPGVWRIWNAGTTAVNCLVLDATGTVEDSWGDGYTVAIHSQVALAAAVATSVLAANAFRRYALIQNNGGGYARITWSGVNPTASTGIRLAPGAAYAFEGKQLVRSVIVGIEETTTTIDVVEGT